MTPFAIPLIAGLAVGAKKLCDWLGQDDSRSAQTPRRIRYKMGPVPCSQVAGFKREHPDAMHASELIRAMFPLEGFADAIAELAIGKVEIEQAHPGCEAWCCDIEVS